MFCNDNQVFVSLIQNLYRNKKSIHLFDESLFFVMRLR